MDEKAALKRLGEYLDLSPSVLKKALKRGREGVDGPAARLGDALLAMRAVDEAKLHDALVSQRLDRLPVSRIFADLAPEESRQVAQLVSERTVPTGEVFITQDDIGDCFYILVEGSALVFRIGDYGEEILLGQVERGESVGEMGYFSGGRRTASVRALSDCSLLSISYTDLKTLFDLSPIIARRFLASASDRLRRANMRFQEYAAKAKAVERSLERLYAFLDLSDVMALGAGIDGLIERTVATACALLRAERGTLFLLDEFNGELWSKVAMGLGKREIRIPVGKGVAGAAATADALINIRDAYKDPRFDASVDKLTGFKTKAILAGPVKNLNGDVVGVIQVINKEGGGGFTDADEMLFKAFAYQTAVAVENFRLYKKVMAGHEKLSILLDVAQASSRTLSVDSLINVIVEKVSTALSAERGTLFLLDEARGLLVSRVALGAGVREITLPVDSGLAGYTARTGRVVNIEDAYQDRRFHADVDRTGGYVTKTILCAPIIDRNGKILGVIESINKREGVFTLEDEELLKAMCSHAAVALENATLYEKTLELKNYLASVHDSITNSIVSLDARGVVVTANKAAVGLFGLSESKLLGEDFTRVLPEAENPRLFELVRKAQMGGAAVTDIDATVTLASGAEHQANMTATPLPGGEDKRGVVVALDDITLERRLRGVLSRYMSKDIVERILEDPRRNVLGGARGAVTVLFADIRGFTGVAEGLSAEKTVEMLNEFFSVMAEAVIENQGVVDKYIGDMIMAVFGAPFPHPSDADRALKTALDMHQALGALNARRADKGEPAIRIGVGVASGEVVLGNVGSEKRMDFTVIGDAVNTAARLESLTRRLGVEILVAESTKRASKDDFLFRQIDAVVLPGKKQVTNVFQLLGKGAKPYFPVSPRFAQAFALYQQGEFAKAAKGFEGCERDDPACMVFKQRCLNLVTSPPQSPWKGVWSPPDK